MKFAFKFMVVISRDKQRCGTSSRNRGKCCLYGDMMLCEKRTTASMLVLEQSVYGYFKQDFS